MKIRRGFVSNSSSSSFVIASKKNIKELEKVLRAIFLYLQTVEDTYWADKDFDDCIKITTVGESNFKECFSDYFGNIKEQTIWFDGEEKEITDDMIYIDSKFDNSIPWAIQGFLENIDGIKKYHWG
jgi:hypothetical protein